MTSLYEIVKTAKEKLEDLNTDITFNNQFLTKLQYHLVDHPTVGELEAWETELDEHGVDAIAAFFVLYGYLPFHVRAMDDTFIGSFDSEEEFAKDLFNTYPASSFGDYYIEYCWETNRFTDRQWDHLDWTDAASSLEADNYYHYVEFLDEVYVFRGSRD